MLEDKRPPPLNIPEFCKKQTSSVGQHEHSPNLTTTRRRRTKVEKVNIKTNEDLIQQSHQMLMNCIDSVDNEVKNLLENQEAQFFNAYRKHSSKVKEEMKQIKNKMLENTQSQKIFIDRINYLEKELIIFRDETLRMSQKLITKNDQIQILKIKLKEALVDNKQQKDSIIELTKTNMSLSAKLMKSQNYKAELLITQGMKAENDVKVNNDKSHLSHLSHLKHHNAHLRIRNQFITKVIASTIQENSNLVMVDKQKHQTIDNKSDSIKTDLSNTNRKRSNSFRAKIERSRLIQTQIEKFKSKSFAQKNQYQKIFIDCVEQVRSGLMRKGFTESLNYFKENGPKNLVEFKKLDYFVLLELFLKKDTISRKIYQLIFEKESL